MSDIPAVPGACSRHVGPTKRSAFDELLARLQERYTVSADGLMAALFAIRAPHDLVGVVPWCRYIDALVHVFPEFTKEPAFDDQEVRFRVLHEIGQLRVLSKERSDLGRSRVARRQNPTYGMDPSSPAYLLLESKPWQRLPTDSALLAVHGWFTWQVMHHQARNESLRQYGAYLSGQEWPRRPMSASSPRLAAASRSLRHLAEDARFARTFPADHPLASARLATLAELMRPFTMRRSLEMLAVLTQFTGNQPDFWAPNDTIVRPDAFRSVRAAWIPRLRSVFPVRTVLIPPVVDRRQQKLDLHPSWTVDGAPQGDPLAPARDPVRWEEHHEPPPYLPDLGRFLKAVWTDVRPTGRVHGVDRRHSRRTGALISTIERYDTATFVSQEVDDAGVQSGIAVDLYEAADPNPPHAAADVRVRLQERKGAGGEASAHRRRVVWSDDPETEVPTEPHVTLFLAAGDMVPGWYAARSAAHHIERENAWLQWPEWRLSDAAIRAVLASVAHGDTPASDAAWARLAIGLSLVSGRSLSAACSARVASGGGEAPYGGMSIDLAKHLLLVPAGTPKLQSIAPETVKAYCTPHAETLRLPLPEVWTPLLGRLVDCEPPPLDTLHRAVERALAAFPADAAVTQKGISNALKLALLDQSSGDLGLVKAVTDADGANFNNIIHYASYDQHTAERHWHSIVQAWAGPLHTVSDDRQPMDPIVIRDAGRGTMAIAEVDDTAGARVGTPYSIDPGKVAPGIAQLKERFREAVAKEHWADVNNLLTLYAAVWLGLATAGRAAREPAPGVILHDGWALIRDKHRPDESTDRYVPLGAGIRAQLNALVDFTAVLGLANESFALPHAGADHLLDLHLVWPDGSVVPFHPGDLEQGDLLRGLPGNWARKVVRACTTELPGRFLDAGLGHWVQGRHPWTLTSTFPAREFRSQWLAVQARLEQQLGMEVLSVPGLHRHRARSVPAAPKRRAQPDASAPYTEKELGAEDESVAALLANCHGERWYDRVFKQQPPDRGAALELAKWAIGHAGGALGTDLIETAKRVCTYIRVKCKIPLFATRPRGRFQHNWLVKRQEFEALAYVEEVLLPTIVRDLRQLPALDVERTRFARRATDAAHQSDIWRKLRIGRLIVALALRAGLVTAAHLEAFLAAIAGDRPLLAIGDTRLVELGVVSRRATDPMCRTVLLEPYVAALTACERDAIRPWLRRAVLDPKIERHAAHWNAALRAYLRSLGLPADITLSMFLAAIRQRIQLDATPLLAAYASGEVLTDDLSLHELMRLAGRALPAASAEGLFGRDADVDATDLHRRGGAMAKSARRECIRAMQIAAEDPPPADVAASSANLPDRLTALKSASPRAWLQRIHGVREETRDRPLDRLLCAFAADLVAAYQYRGGHRDQANRAAELGQGGSAPLFGPKRPPRATLSPRFRSWARSHLAVVWAGLAGFSAVLCDRPRIDEDVVQALAEATEAHFPVRRHRAAWSRFRYFLTNPWADHAGFEVGVVDTGRLRTVSAKLLSRAQLDRAAAYLGSVRSGLGSSRTRAVACRHFALVRATGARRAEAAHLRWADVDGNCLRIRPYDGHTLKTPASERVIPAQLLDPRARPELRQRPGERSDSQFIADGQVDGANFFDAEAKAIKYGGGDADLGPHHLRHTKANALLLKVLGTCVDISLLDRDFPWVTTLLPRDSELEALLGRGGQCGQGLQAISMLLGHLHPTTTLKHYIHTLCLALYAYALGQPAIPLHRAFGNRIKGRAALYRHAQRTSDPAEATRYALGRVEADAAVWHRALGRRVPLVVAAAPSAPPQFAAAPSASGEDGSAAVSTTSRESDAPPGWTVAELESWQQYFGAGGSGPPRDAQSLRSALRAISAIPTGKRGSHSARHPLPVSGREGTQLPAMIRSGSEARHAQQLLDWLAELRRDRRADFDWLLDKWLYASEAQEGLMRLDGGEHERAESLPRTFGVIPEIRAGHVAANRIHTGAVSVSHLRIQFARQAGLSRKSEPQTATPLSDHSIQAGHLEARREPRYAGRTNRVVRWVLSWLAAERGGIRAVR